MEEGLHRPIRRVVATVDQESQGYHECTRQFFTETVPSRRNRTIVVESQRIYHIQQSNHQELQRLEHVVLESEQIVNTVQSVIRAWARAQSSAIPSSELLPLVADHEQCSLQNRTNLTQWIWGSTPSHRQVLQLFDVYRDHVDTYTARLANYSMARATYDYNYFVGLKARLDGFDFSFHMPNIDLSSSLDIDADLLNILDGKVLNVLNDAMVRVILLERRLIAFFESLNKFDVHYRDLYDRMVSAAEFLRDFLPRGIPMPSALKVDGIPVADVLLPEIFEVPYFYTDLPSLSSVRFLYANALRERLLVLRQKLLDKISDHIQRVEEKMKEFLLEHFNLEDYNPPLFGNTDINETIDRELKILKAVGMETRQSLDQSIRQSLFPNLTSAVIFDGLPISNMTPPDLEDEATVAEFLQPEIPLIFLPRMFMMLFLFFINHRWLVETVVQCFRAWHLFRRFRKAVTPITPKIVYDKQFEGNPYTATLSLIQTTVFKHFVTPWMAMCLVLLPFAVVGATLWLPHVQTSCIDSSKGTILARHVMVPMLINQAMMSGNTEHVQRQFSCHRETELVCYNLFASSEEAQKMSRNEFENLSFAQRQSKDSFNLLKDCINYNELDGFFQQACCGLQGYDSQCKESKYACPMDNTTSKSKPFPPPSTFLSQDSFADNLSDFWLDDGRFNCSTLNNICSAGSCPGVNRTLLAKSVIKDECHVEVYAVKLCLSVVVALYHAVVLNLACTLIFCGLKQLSWKKISPDNIQLVTFMDRHGQIVKGTQQKDRSRQIAVIMRRMEVVGRLQLALGGWILVMWVISFRILRELLWKLR
jgi:hypothetical protein